ncbi:1-acyl-sn-glycerol-3-phosphate acyltransferase [Mycoplasmopsis californica]|uniref:1-acyl-sn-glycerol-3-phosphate acyltransferase n=1 Tax=Mycoplasmopsis equigenitalium TaxID=114883 RepID=A0ABY5J501_9BACT|nr:lysophospholipid acyltransferase family protein [Mycoplasmopsis equigenitalium]UUD37207.1 1-acyl-sn-glycerol-3-phosphate acyltransferase [Mycoplasmopsis equigenitalium]VEU69489.1 1-acyl-sn-glycerol-3-phosphate acyltransferase [Mycoplasmopsis californica]
MTPRAKLILTFPLWIWRMTRINKRARKYRKAPDLHPLQSRQDFIVKYVTKMLKTLNVEVETKGLENLHKSPCLLIPNHTSNIDVLAIIYALRKQSFEQDEANRLTTFIAKKELTKKHVVRNAMSLLDTFVIDRNKAKESYEISKNFGAFVKANKTYGVIFPEGTRSKDGKMNEFKSGAFDIAKAYFLPIVPVSIINGFGADKLSRRGKQKITIIFHSVIKPMTFVSQDRKKLAQSVQQIVQNGVENYDRN